MKAVIPAAGLGTRFLPATKAQPKEMLPLIDKPTIQFVVEEAVESGIDDILIVTGRGKRAIEDHFDKSFELEQKLQECGKSKALAEVRHITELADISYVRQKEQKGLGDAILCAKKYTHNEPFAVLLGDDIIRSKIPVVKQLMNFYNKYQTSILAVERIPKLKLSNYGIIATNNQKENGCFDVSDLIEKPKIELAPSNLGIIGRYILTPQIFDVLKNTKVGVGGELQLTDALKNLLNIQKIHAYEFEGKRYDIGSKIEYVKAIIDFAFERKDMGQEIKEYVKMRF